ncbi:MAG: hypothetical protein JOZ38_12610 [Candidatus Eremiobacteraeota bacterium]|nr:hypothetical protein [Candidatus Eremiobacteraeota bacterium]
MKSLARVILFIVTALVVAVYYVPAWHVDYLNQWGEGTYGFSAVLFGQKLDDVTNPQLLRDGIRPGDRVRVGDVYDWNTATYPWRGQQRTFEFETAHGTIREHLTAQAVPGFGVWQRIGGVLALIPETVFLVVAVLLVALRPSAMTWSFYLYAVGYFGTRPAFAFYGNVLPRAPFEVMTFVLATVFGSWAALPLIPFVLRFPDNKMTGWRKRVDPFVWAFLALMYVAYVWEWAQRDIAGAGPVPISLLLDNYVPLVAFAAAALIVIENFKRASPEVRQRMAWLVSGTLVSLFAYGFYYIPGVSVASQQVVGFLAVLMPISIGYAVLVHRVIGVGFALNRAIVYGALSIVLVAFVSLLDWISGKVVSATRLATGIEALVTIGLGFVLNRTHQTFERWVDRIFFGRQHRAERYLRRVAAALPFATDEQAIVDGLVREPVNALHLTGAAFYRRGDDGTYRFAAAERASPAVGHFERDNRLVRFLMSEEAVVWLEDLRAPASGSELDVFVLAVPVLVRHELRCFVLYGAHRSGAQLDPDEVKIFEEPGVEASRALDHIEAVRAREDADAMRRRLERYEPQPV